MKIFNPKEFLSEYRAYIIKKYGKKWDRTYLPIDLISEFSEYYMMLSSRSDGKTFSVLEMGIYLKCNYNYALGIIRRWDDDLKPKTASEIVKNLIGFNEITYERTKGKYNNVLEEISGGKWNSIKYLSRKFYFAKIEDGKEDVIDTTPFAYTFAISMEEHYKMTSYPDVMITLFDEFITRGTYLDDEAVSYFNVISTIIRHRDNVINFLCANTISLYCPYFKEMGISKIKKMECGDIDTYEYNDKSGNPIMHLRIEYIKSIDKKYKKSNKYFAFDNPKLRMIDEGKFELRMYPHLKKEDRYERTDVKYIYFIIFDDEVLQCEIVFMKDKTFTFIHRKTSKIRLENNTLVFTTEFNSDYHYRRKITKPSDTLGKKILSYYARDLIFYQDNEVGNIVENYLEFCTY